MSPITTDRQKLIDRITKLLALADSTNHTAEAESARRMAAELMAKHAISSTQVTGVDAEFTVHKEDSGRQTKATYETTLLQAIAAINGVALITGVGYYKFIGRTADIEAFSYMRDIIYNQRNMAWRAYYPTRWGKHPGASELNKWKMGFAFGVANKIYDMIRACDDKQTEWGLVPVQQHVQANNWYKENNKVSTTKGRNCTYNAAGYQSGQQVALNKGVAAQNGTRLGITH